ncbi:MAG: ABC transporter ATP-binding protein [Akkermansiaceae bacterium]|nr:ABC transporter ATP-binding protein [Akkermansiaceae bacterium]
MSESEVLCLEGFSKSFGDVVALDDVSLSVKQGEVVALRGPSGAGKSTLLYMIAGLLAPDAGTVKVAGVDPYTLSSSKRTLYRSGDLRMVFQDARLISYLNIRENILVAGGDPQRADELMESLGLRSRGTHVPKMLSAGEQQRAGLARALVTNPKLVLADEPTGNLDEENTDLVIAGLRRCANEGGAALVVTHDPQVIEGADRVLNLEEGQLLP